MKAGQPAGILRRSSDDYRQSLLGDGDDAFSSRRQSICSANQIPDKCSVRFYEEDIYCKDMSSGLSTTQINNTDKVRFNYDKNTIAIDEEEDEDYSASISAILQRRASSRKGKRRMSSPYSHEDFSAHSTPRRRSSVFTTTSTDTAVSIEEPVVTEEQIYENIRLHKEVITSVKLQPWGMKRKLKLVQQAKAYVKKHEGELQVRLKQSRSTRDILARFNIVLIKKWQHSKRELANFMNVLIPWELRIKEIESHFGSVVASYFTFLRWLFWVNLVISIALATFVIAPEVLLIQHKETGERKTLLPEEQATSLDTILNFEGVLKYSPIFYGFYSNREDDTSYRLPTAYFIVGLAMYVYSFIAILRKMAINFRLSKLSEKEDECIFTWKLFTGWDYMIGNAETAHNRTSSIILGFKEALLEEAEKKKEKQSWKIVSLRIFVNIIVVWMLIFSAFAVVMVVDRSNNPEVMYSKSDNMIKKLWHQNEITIVISAIGGFFPFVFELFGFIECYHPRKTLRIQLARIMALNLLNIYTMTVALFVQITGMTTELQQFKLDLKNSNLSKTVEPYSTMVSPSNITIPYEIRTEMPVEKAEILKSLSLIKFNDRNLSSPSIYYDSKNVEGFVLPLQDIVNDISSSEFHTSDSNNSLYSSTFHSYANKSDNMFKSTDNSNESTKFSVYTTEYFSTDTSEQFYNYNEDFFSTDTSRSFSDYDTEFFSADTSEFTTLPYDDSKLFPFTELVIGTDNCYKIPVECFEISITELTPEDFSETTDTLTTWFSEDTGTYKNSTIPTMSQEEEFLKNYPSFTDPAVKLDEYSSKYTKYYNLTSSIDKELTLTDVGLTSTDKEFTSTDKGLKSTSDFKLGNYEDYFEIKPNKTCYKVYCINVTTTDSVTESEYPISEQSSTQDSSDLDTTTDGFSTPDFTSTETSMYEISSNDSTFSDISSIASSDNVSSTTATVNGSSIASTASTVHVSTSTKEITTQRELLSSSPRTYSNTSEQVLTENDTVVEYTTKQSDSSSVSGHSTVSLKTTTPIMDIKNSSVVLPVMEETSKRETDTPRVTSAATLLPTSVSEKCPTGKLDEPYEDLSPLIRKLPSSKRQELRRLCWETMFGQELVKLTVLDLVTTVLSTFFIDFVRALFVRYMNKCWCWDLEKRYPKYGDFKIAENILHLVNNQGMVWMGMFFSPGLPLINVAKLMIMMYLRSWAVLTCNVPHEVVFRASRSNNFYLALLLTMLFLCVLPVGYAIVWLKPSWHCGPFSNQPQIYFIFTTSLKRVVPDSFHRIMDYIASPGTVIPLLMILLLIIYYLASLTSALREANNDLKIQLRRERTEERRKMFQMASRRRRGGSEMDSTLAKWRKILQDVPSTKHSDDVSPLPEERDKWDNKKRGTGSKKSTQEKKMLERDDEKNGDDTDADNGSLLHDEITLIKKVKTQLQNQKPSASKWENLTKQITDKKDGMVLDKQLTSTSSSNKDVDDSSIWSSENIPEIKISHAQTIENFLKHNSNGNTTQSMEPLQDLITDTSQDVSIYSSSSDTLSMKTDTMRRDGVSSKSFSDPDNDNSITELGIDDDQNLNDDVFVENMSHSPTQPPIQRRSNFNRIRRKLQKVMSIGSGSENQSSSDPLSGNNISGKNANSSDIIEPMQIQKDVEQSSRKS